MDIIDGIEAVSTCCNLIILASDGCEYKSDGKKWHLFKSMTFEDVELDDDWISRQIVINYLPRSTPFNSPLREKERGERPQKNDHCQEHQYPVLPKKRGRPPKQKRCTREPTDYNIFVKSVMSMLREKQPGLDNHAYLRECAKLWKEKKAQITKSVLQD